MEGWQWDELYENTEDRTSRHPIHPSANIKVQFHIWPELIQRAGVNVNLESLKELHSLGVETVPSDPCVKSLREDSSLSLISGFSQKTKRFTWRTDSRKQTIDTLLDCGVPIVLSEDVKTDRPSQFVKAEGGHFVAISYLYGDLTHSTSLLNAPTVCKVKTMTELPQIPPAILIIGDPHPENAKSDIAHPLYYDRIDAISRRS